MKLGKEQTETNMWLSLIDMPRFTTFETENSEFIYSEITISNKKQVCFSVYQPLSQDSLEFFFEELTYNF